MEVIKTDLNQLLIIKSEIFQDHRGINFQSYSKNLFEKSGVALNFIQDALSRSKKNVLRGFHGDYKTWKLISCLYGEFFMVIADFNEESSQYLQTQTFTLSADKPEQILVPPGLAIAHLALSDEIIFHYKQTTEYDRSSQFTYAWNDPRIKIEWPSSTPILSERDNLHES